MSFLNPVLRLDRDAMVAYILAIPTTGFRPNPNDGVVWAPKGVVWHNTGSPSLGLWDSWPETTRENYINGLNAYYRKMGWHSGPHAMGTPETWSAVLCDLQADGVHDSCRNADHFGVETVLNAVPGGDDPTTGRGLLAMQASANIIAALCIRFGFDPKTAIDFHRTCTNDHHACPGVLVTNEFAIRLVEARMEEIKSAAPASAAVVAAQPPAPQPAPVAPPDTTLPTWPAPDNVFFNRAAQVYNAWRGLGVSIPFALAMVTQAEFESAFETNAVGDHDQAFNIYQWHWDPRGERILDKTKTDVRSETSLLKLVEAAWWELNNTEIKARDAIAAAKTAREASIAACTLFEGAGAPDAAQRRGLGAERWSVWVNDNEAFIAANPAQ